MNIFLKRLLGLLLLIIALGGVGLCILTGIIVFQSKNMLLNRSISSLDLLLKTIQTTSEGLDLASQALDNAIESVDNLDSSLQTVGATIDNSTHFMDTAATLSGKTLPETIDTTRKAIDSASQSAKLIDDTLSIIAAIPFVGGQYNPETPMSKALSEVSISLSDLPGTFIGIEDDFVEIKKDMLDLETKLTEAHTQLEKIHTSLLTAKEVVKKYKDMLTELQPRFTEMKAGLPGWLNMAVYGILIFICWFALSQLGLIVQGVTLLTSPSFKP